jgi:DUF4097 and DUF4098 domain-containing protein YvlB
MRQTIHRSLSVLIVLVCAAIPGFATSQVTTHTYPLSSGGKFTLKNVNGSVQVDGWEREEVEVEAVKSARSSPGDLDRVQIDIQPSPGAVAVYTRYPQGDGVEVAVDYRIRVPYRVLLSGIETVNGSVSVRGVDGSGELRSVNGDVDVVDSAGRFSARTTNGNVRLELRQVKGEGPMDLATVNGSLLLALPADARAILNVRSMNGDFHSDLPLETTASVNGRIFRGRLGSGSAGAVGAEVTLTTVNGAIRVVRERPTV